jgi:hypothetical protein
MIQKKVTAGEFYIETSRGEDANIASLQGIQKPYQLDDPMVGCHCSANREICIMKGRMLFVPTRTPKHHI